MWAEFVGPQLCSERFLVIKGHLCFFLSEGGSADYIITGAWSAKAAKEVRNVIVGRACNCHAI